MTELKNGYIQSTSDYDNRVKSSFSKQQVMNLLGAELVKVGPVTATMMMLQGRSGVGPG